MNDQVKRLPDFIGVGAPKSGTTWLATCLREHPEIYIPDQKEVVYFSSEAKLKRGLDWYLENFKQADPGQTVGEFSVPYLSSGRVVAERIYKMNPAAKIIAVLRDPVHRAYSHFRWLQQIGRLDPNVDFLDALKLRRELVADSSYGQSLSEYLEVFEPANILLVPYEGIATNPMKLINDVYYFLSISEDYVPTKIATKIGVTIRPRIRLLEKLRVKIYRFSRVNNQLWMISWVKRFGVSQLYRRINNHPKKYDISQAEYNLAASYFKDDLLRLKTVTTFDISVWPLSSKLDISQ